ncbi:hypothetical protein EZJ55_10355 [Microcystis aeruginosa EAWAG127a]|uniref:Uncharacterized protein n=1 Tax=Microcystis aeruginosa EAWAG127a TaxID=2529855 RepID=A0A5J5LU58_MICAE|nr:hypothetical protein EZJ55_10355 [Microcystis aeruginosa EAWAG127a]
MKKIHQLPSGVRRLFLFILRRSHLWHTPHPTPAIPMPSPKRGIHKTNAPNLVRLRGRKE